ncbi:DNA-binding domain-containing protein [Marinobacterium sp. D7]|uniref:HvfC/BufC N-terminal domain-containing protein n=1 Tax=Marinobacterium ramblicola TaxID=2849041 RepID=UPI001C2D41BB|nr:DNA-binding domain-containing protein [Marinobacterium ramblicola]MBV1786799.1 DNA-binding domain-containing protein [Marinobacterium ramblicola]
MSRIQYPEAQFEAALLDPSRPVPEGLYAWNGSDPTARFDVYRNNVIVSLIEALESTFSVVLSLVGETFFRAMAREYLHRQMPDNPVLSYFGGDFPDFIDQFEPAATLPYLADTARLEWFRVRAYHAPDAEPLSFEALQQALAQPERLPTLGIVLHPSAHLLQSRYAVVSLWAAHQGLLQLSQVDPMLAEQALILRPELEVEVIPLDDASARFISSLQQGLAMGSALENTLSSYPDFDLNSALVTLLKRRALLSFED